MDELSCVNVASSPASRLDEDPETNVSILSVKGSGPIFR